MPVTLNSPDVQALADKVSALNNEIEVFYQKYGDTVRVTGHCNYRTDCSEPYFHVTIDITSVVAHLS